VQELRRSKRARKEMNFDNDFIAYIVDDDPTCYSEALNLFDAFILVRGYK
jgi:hypothetical protein